MRSEVCSNWELRTNFSGCCCEVDPFFAFRERFSLSEAVSAHTLPGVDIYEKKVVRTLSLICRFLDGVVVPDARIHHLNAGVTGGHMRIQLALQRFCCGVFRSHAPTQGRRIA
jgi:hypothetical protein